MPLREAVEMTVRQLADAAAEGDPTMSPLGVPWTDLVLGNVGLTMWLIVDVIGLRRSNAELVADLKDEVRRSREERVRRDAQDTG